VFLVELLLGKKLVFVGELHRVAPCRGGGGVCAEEVVSTCVN